MTSPQLPSIFALAEAYARQTGCTAKEAMLAACEAGMILAALFDVPEAQQHFEARRLEIEFYQDENDTSMVMPEQTLDEPGQITALVPANDIQYRQAQYRNSYWI